MAVVAIPVHYGVERERLWAHRNRIWIGGRRARAHLSKQTAHFDRRASSESRYEHTTRIDLNISETQFDRWAPSESDLDHIRGAGVSAPMVSFARHASSENDLRTSRGSRFVIENCVSLDGGRAKCENTETAPFGNIPDCHKWTEGSIIVQKRPFGTFTLASVFSYPGLGLVDILDSKKCQTGFHSTSPEIKKRQIWKRSFRGPGTLRRI